MLLIVAVGKLRSKNSEIYWHDIPTVESLQTQNNEETFLFHVIRFPKQHCFVKVVRLRPFLEMYMKGRETRSGGFSETVM